MNLYKIGKAIKFKRGSKIPVPLQVNQYNSKILAFPSDLNMHIPFFKHMNNEHTKIFRKNK